MTKKEINFIMDKCLNQYRIASASKDNIYEKMIARAKGNVLKDLIEDFLDDQPRKREYEKYQSIVKYYQILNP